MMRQQKAYRAAPQVRAVHSLRRIAAAMALAMAGGVCGYAQSALAEAPASGSFSLFGSPRCTEWAGMTPDARLAWTRAYLSTISKAYLEIRGANNKAKTAQDIDQAVIGIDQYCANHPDEQASEGITPFLQ